MRRFIQIPDFVLANAQLTATAKLLYGVIANEDRLGNRKRGVRWFAGRLGMHTETICRAIRELEGSGLVDACRDIRGKRGTRGGHRGRTTYTLKRPQSAGADNSMTAPAKDGRSAREGRTLASAKPGHGKEKETKKEETTSQRTLFGVLLELFPELTDKTEKWRRRIGKLASDLSKLETTKDEVRAAHERYKTMQPDPRYRTPESFVDNYGKYAQAETLQGGRSRVEARPGEYTNVPVIRSA